MRPVALSSVLALAGGLAAGCSGARTYDDAYMTSPASPGAVAPPTDGGPATDGASNANANNDGGDGDGATEAGPGDVPGPSICDPAMTLGDVAAVVTDTPDRFGAISGDERTVAWLALAGDDANVVVADRDATTHPFGSAQLLAGAVARDGLTIAPDGRTLVAVASGRKSFVVFARAARTGEFARDATEAYDALTGDLTDAESVGDPVFAYGDLVLVYSRYGASSDTVRYATRLSSTSPFNAGGALGFEALRAQGERRRRPSGVGSDFQTLFYWDEVTTTEKLAHLAGTVGVFGVEDLGPYPWAQPNDGCTKLYFGNQEVASAAAR